MTRKKEIPCSEIVARFSAMIREIKVRYYDSVAEIAQKEKEECDLLHAIEFSGHCEERSKLCTQLHRVRKDRRKAKDFMLSYGQIIKFFGRNDHLEDTVGALIGLLRKAENPPEKHYSPRALDDLPYGEQKEA